MKRKKQTTVFQLGTTGKRIHADITEPDAHPVEQKFTEALARLLEIAADADKGIVENGTVQTFETGARNVSPEFTVFRSALADATKLAKELPKIREALNTGTPEEEIKENNIYSIAKLG